MAVSPKLQADFAAALAEAEVLKLTPERSEEQTSRLKQLGKELLPKLKARIEDETEADAINLEDYGDMTKPVGTPYNAVVKSAGSTTISEDGEVEDIGPGAIQRAKLKRLAEPKYQRAFKSYLYYGEDNLKHHKQATYKTLSEGIDEGAGYFVPPQMLNEILRRRPAPTSLDGRVRQITTNSNKITMLRTTYRDNIHTSPINGSWVGEGGDPAKSPEATYGEVSIDVHEYMGRTSFTNTQLEDSGFDLEGEFNANLMDWKNLHFERYIWEGTGVGQPRGLKNSINTSGSGESAAGLAGYVETASTGLIDADTVKSMRFSVLPQYQDPGFGFVFNQKTAKTISLLKSPVSSDYLFQRGQVFPGIVEPTPDQIDGFPIAYCQFAEDIATGKYIGFFGSARGYFKPVRMGLSVRRLTEIEALQNRVVYMFRLRWGGRLVQEEQIKWIKIK